MITFISLSTTAISQVGSKVAPTKNGCGTDYFFRDCKVSSPEGSIRECKYILGSFGTCGCTQMYRTNGATT